MFNILAPILRDNYKRNLCVISAPLLAPMWNISSYSILMFLLQFFTKNYDYLRPTKSNLFGNLFSIKC